MYSFDLKIEVVANDGLLPYTMYIGNHESECHGVYCMSDVEFGRHFSNFSAYNARWHMPANGALAMWYNYTYKV